MAFITHHPPHHLQLQPKSSNLKWPQLNLHLAPLNSIFLFIILQHIRFPHLLNIQTSLNSTLTRSPQTIIDTQDHTLSLPLFQLPSAYILIILASLHRIQDKTRVTGQLDRGTERLRFQLSWSLHQLQRIVEIKCRSNSRRAELSLMRQNSPADIMAAHISMRVWSFGGAEERETHDVAAGGEAVFGVVEDGDAVAVLGEVGVFMAADLEFGHVPAGKILVEVIEGIGGYLRGVIVGWAAHDTELGLVGGFGVPYVDWEFYLEESHGLAPLDLARQQL